MAEVGDTKLVKRWKFTVFSTNFNSFSSDYKKLLY
jgi:hypothetical protein